MVMATVLGLSALWRVLGWQVPAGRVPVTGRGAWMP